MAEETTPQTYQKVEIELCPLCRIPKEYCEYGPKAAKCKAANQQTTATEGTEQTEVKEGEQAPQEKKPAKGKNDKKIIVEKAKKNKKFTITKIIGVKQFGLKQQDVSKFMAKKFSVGANIDKTQGIDCINVQGEFVGIIADLLVEHFKIDRDDIEVKE